MLYIRLGDYKPTKNRVKLKDAASEGRLTTIRWRRIVAEALGTALLLAAVVGSGIMGQRLAGGNVGVALLANTLATVRPW